MVTAQAQKLPIAIKKSQTSSTAAVKGEKKTAHSKSTLLVHDRYCKLNTLTDHNNKSIKNVWYIQFKDVYSAGGHERLDLIKSGIKAKLVAELAQVMFTSQDYLMDTLGFSRTTILRKIANQQDLSTEHAERIVGLIKLVGQVEQMISESGDAKGFDAPKWTKDWLETEAPALGNHKPAEYMDTVEGQHIVSSLLAQMQSGAYA